MVVALEHIRRLRGLSQRELAEKAGVSPATVYELEVGKRPTPRPSTLRKLAEALEVEIADLIGEPAVPLAEAPGEAGHAQTSTRTIEEFERTLAYVMEPVEAEALKEQQSVNRLVSSEGQRQNRVVDPPEAEVAKRFLNELSPEERPIAFSEVALGRARFARESATLEQNNAHLRKLLRERDRKIVRLEEEVAQVREEHKRVEAEKA
jgi:transcriptional regulator with XRE-family HTH domain